MTFFFWIILGLSIFFILGSSNTVLTSTVESVREKAFVRLIYAILVTVYILLAK